MTSLFSQAPPTRNEKGSPPIPLSPPTVFLKGGPRPLHLSHSLQTSPLSSPVHMIAALRKCPVCAPHPDPCVRSTLNLFRSPPRLSAVCGRCAAGGAIFRRGLLCWHRPAAVLIRECPPILNRGRSGSPRPLRPPLSCFLCLFAPFSVLPACPVPRAGSCGCLPCCSLFGPTLREDPTFPSPEQLVEGL